MLSANTTFTAQWKAMTTKYTITKGAHDHGDFTIDPTSQEEGETVTLTATPNEDYLLSSWTVLKTEDDSETGITVDANGQFEMPAYAVTVNATFAADTRDKVLYVTSTSAADTQASDKLYDALKDDYNVKIVGPTSEETVTSYALVVLHESVNGSNHNATAVAAAKGGAVPVLNTKSYFYNSGRWDWGTPNNGQAAQKVATINDAYCNADAHPIFAGIDVTGKTVTVLTNDITSGNTMQPIGSFTSGKEGYTIATTPNNGEGNGCAIHELTPTQRGVASGKYLMMSVSNAGLNNLSADGQRLFKNAAAYLIDGSVHWTPVVAPTSPAIAGTTAYSAGATIELTASATGTSASTTYTWYKGDTWAEAETAGAIQAAETAANNGNVYSKATCVLGDAGTYWCVIANDPSCMVSVSQEITVSDESYDITFVSAHGTAPTATTGVSYDLPELTESGWEHQGWTASIDVTVDAATVTAGTLIANGKMAVFGADVAFTAVWAEVFEVTFNMQSHGAAIDAQDVVDGGKVTKPDDPAVIGWDFGGWFTDAECTAGNEWDFANDVVTEDTELFAKWTAFGGCTLLVPATTGDAPAVGDEITMQTGSTGGTMHVVGTPVSYNTYGLGFDSSSSAKAKVTINNDIQEGTVISLTLVANGTSAPRGLHL